MGKIKLRIVDRFSGLILFEYEKENNTIKDTLKEEVKLNADLRNADLRNADLRNADLRNADLGNADLSYAYLSYAYLRYADLSYADLGNAYLSNADLRNADLRNADLSYAYLSNADLRNADLSNADLSNADLSYADLRYAKNVPYYPLACPSDGSFIGWKKVSNHLVKLKILEDAKRSSASSRKCRCDKAMVLAITDLEEKNQIEEIWNRERPREQHVLYKVGEIVFPDSFDENRWEECSHGIHFFINKQDAIDY